MSAFDFAPAQAAGTPQPLESGLVAEATPTPLPTTIGTPPPGQQSLFPGVILFTRGGNIVAARSGEPLRELTRQETDSSPTWSENGRRIIYVRTTQREMYPNGRERAKHTFYLTDIMAANADGSNRRRIFESLFAGGAWYTTAIQPDLSPNGRTIALVSDGRNRPSSETDVAVVRLSTMAVNGRNFRDLGLQDSSLLGHNDPEYSPDGRRIALSYNSRSGSRVGVLNLQNQRFNLSRRDYANPSWSPDGRYIVCERTTESGRDIVVLDPRSWAEVARMTNDGNSFAPVWSSNGDQIAYLRRNGLEVDLWLMTLDHSGQLTLVENAPITEDGFIDPDSTPAWFIPAEERTPVATPAAAATTLPALSPAVSGP
jgi:Tol biopolymer transport system component